MSSKRILIFSTYPIKNPQHGGQKRTAAIFDEYEKAFGQVRYCGVFYRGFYKDHSSDDAPLGPKSVIKVKESPLTGDIVCGEAIYNDPAVKKKVTRLLITFRPEIIHIEQPFPYLGLKPLLKELGMEPKIIFGSQNIEAPMKRAILEGVNVPEEDIKKIEASIHELETELSKASDLLAACTKSDMEAHKKMGAKTSVLAQNGIARSYTTPADRAHWKNIFDDMGVTRTVLFVGSAHPPNWTGFLDTVSKGLGFMPQGARLVIAGSVCDFFDRTVKASTLDVQDATFWLRAYSAGRLSEERLGALIQLADVILLPITEGGGSNLKTAEAILADKKVVATSHALRSFEWFSKFPNVWVSDRPADFQSNIVAALESSKKERTDQQKELAKQVDWQHCLAALIKKVEAL